MPPEVPRRVVYLHGFASSPRSNKARCFVRALEEKGIAYEVPDLNEGCFRELTISRQLGLLERLTRDDPPRTVVLIGSSLGGYTSALFAARSDVVAALVLMAPAFDFARRWAERLGQETLARWRERGAELVPHHGSGTEELIGFGLMEDAATHEAYPRVRVPTLVFQGQRDDVVDPEVATVFCERCPEASLVELDDDHTLAGTVDEIVVRSLRFLEPLGPWAAPARAT